MVHSFSTRGRQNEFYFSWLENSDIEIGEMPLIPLMFDHLSCKPFYLVWISAKDEL